MTRYDLAVGIIGPGAIAGSHARALESLGARVVAAAGPERADLDEYGAEFGVPALYDDHHDLLADDSVDVVIVSAPSAVHAALAIDALDAGKPVLVEVPVALSLQDARAAVAVADRAALPFAVGHTLRYWAPHRELARLLAESGHPATHVMVRSLQLRQSDVGWTGKVRSWTDSAVWHHGSHAVDAALWFLGDPAVSSLGVLGAPWTNGSVMDAAFSLRTDDSRIGRVELSYHSRRAISDFVVITEADTFEITGGQLWRNDQLLIDGDVASTQERAVAEQDAAFLATVLGDVSAGLFRAADALPALAVLGGRTWT